MTTRLYYDDSYTTEFTAQIAERVEVDGRPAVVLDRTYFYPTGGGQPCDTGTINGRAVVEVQTREGDQAVLHILDAPLTDGADARCTVDWARRFDHMQQHTGQHILTQAFVQTCGAQTVGFHLSPETLTIDLNKTGLSSDDLDQTESLAASVVFRDLPVTARTVDPNDTEGVRIRRMPEHLLTSGLRIIEIGNFDTTACGGTHVARTGEIGLIKVVRAEKRGDKTRVEFRCGGRALDDYRAKNAAVNRLAAELSCGMDDFSRVIDNLRADLKAAQTALRAATSQLIEFEAARLLAETPVENGVRVIKAALEGRDAADLKTLANKLVAAPGTLALLGTAGDKAQLVLARAGDAPGDMREALKRALPLLDPAAKGGGQPSSAQGGGVRASLDAVRAALDEAERALFAPES